MSCVNKSSKEFKALATNNNLNDNALELIIHKYWLETGSEDSFPTNVYIQAQLGNTQYKETIPSVIKLWHQKYSFPLTFRSYKELQSAYKEAAKCFPESAIVYYRNKDNDYVLSVKQPVRKISNTAKDFFDDGIATKKLNLGIEENKTYTLDKVEKLFNKFNTDRTSKFLADKVFKTARQLGLQIQFTNDLPNSVGGRSGHNNVQYNKNFFETNLHNDMKARILLHEIIHTVTVYALTSVDTADGQSAGFTNSKQLIKFRNEIQGIYDEVRFNPALKGQYGLRNIYEFVAELSNPIFREKLQSIEVKKKSLWTRILDAFKSLFGIHSSSTYYNRSMKALDNALKAFDIDGYLLYNNMKKPLQQAYNDHRVSYEDMTESELKSMLKKAIKENDTALENKDINKTIDDYINGKEQFNNLSKEENDTARRDKLLAGGEVAARIHGSSNREESQDERNERQEKQVEEWAKKEGVWHDNALSFGKSFGNEVKGGQESHIYVNEKNKSVIKVKATTQYHDLQEFLDGIVLHNTIFPETAYRVLGFGNDGEGFVAILEQLFIVGEEPTQEQITDYVKSKVPDVEMYEEGIGNGRYKTTKTLLHDISPKNAILTPNGNIAVIDDIIRPNIESEGKGGLRSNDYNMSPVNRQLSSFIDSMSKEQLVSELNKIKQEYEDYDLTNEEPQSPTGQSTFTFNDGTTLKTPFKPTAQQAEALNVMDDFIHSDNEVSMTLAGYAGTGKTSLMEIIAEKAKRDHNPIVFTASTNKATAVLKQKVNKLGYNAQTFNKVFGINVEVDRSTPYNANNLVTKLVDAKVFHGTTVVIDEASMINEENYNLIKKIANENALKVIFVGDRGQLAPVKDKKISPVFRDPNAKVVELTKVERTDDNAILKEATDLRNGKALSMQSSFNNEGKGVAYIKPEGEGRKKIADVITYYTKGIKNNSDYFKVLAYTDKKIEQYNSYIRHLLGFDDPTPRVGESIMGYTNWGRHYNRATRQTEYDFINSEGYKVTKVGKPRIISGTEEGVNYKLTAIPVTLRDSLNNEKVFNIIDIKNNRENLKYAQQLAKVKANFENRAWKLKGKMAAELHSRANAIEQLLFVNADIANPDNTDEVWQKKVFDYGYAMTIHKSQGSTFTNIIIDENNISKAEDYDNYDTVDMSNAVSTVNLEDAATNGDVQVGRDKLTGISDVIDLGDLGEEAPIKQQVKDSDIPNKKQQLNYVAVSRATDTVTIISDKTQKEDTPLNHLVEKGADKPIVEVQRPSVPEEAVKEQKPTQSQIDNNIVQQEIEHLNTISGVKVQLVNGQQELMQQLQNENSIVQEVRPIYNYNNKERATKAEREEILDAVKANKYNISGTDAVVLKNNPNTIYLIDHSSDKELQNNLKDGGDGFGIRKKYNVDKLTKEDIYEITRNIAPQYNYSETSIRRMLSRLGVKSADLLGVDITDAIKRGANDNAMGNGTSRTSQSSLDNNRSSINGRENTREISFLETPEGVIYGYATRDGRIVLDNSVIKPEHPLHEYTHLWDRIVAQRNPELWQRGIELMKQFNNGKLWQQFADDEHYGKKWAAIKGITQQQFDSMVASEVHARLVGENGAKLLDSIAKQKGQKGIVAKLKAWILEVWQNLKSTFSNWSDDDIKKLTLKDFNHMTVRDFADAIDLNTINNTDNRSNNNNTENNGTERANADTTGVQQGSVQRNIRIYWGQEGGSRGGRPVSQERLEGNQEGGTRVRGYDSDVAKQVSEASTKLDKILADKDIKATTQKVHKSTSQEFHDAIASAKKDNPNGWMIDVHDVSDYDNCLTMLTEDGKSGIAVTKDGDIISVFSGVSKGRRLEKLMQMAIAAGGRKLDCYYLSTTDSKRNDRGLPILYARFGFKVDAVTPFNEQYAPEDYKEWQKRNPDRKIEGVAAMSLKVKQEDAIDSYSKDNTPDIDQAPEFNGDNGYDQALQYRDNMIKWQETGKWSLPNYKYFNDFNEDISVDASWKIPLLQELDNKLNNNNTSEENNKILEKMNNILKAKVEEDVKETSTEKEEQINKNIDEYDKINQQFDRLLNGEFDKNGEVAQGEKVTIEDMDARFSATEIRDVAELIGNYMTDMITKLQTGEAKVEDLFPELKFEGDVDFTKLSRKDIVTTLGINNIIARTKYDFTPINDIIPIDGDAISKAFLALENWDALMLLASDAFAFNEGFGISKNYNDGGFNVAEGHYQVSVDNFNNDDTDAKEDTEGDSQENWQIDQRTVDTLNSMTALVRQHLHSYFVLDKDNNKVTYKDWGLPLRVNPRKTTNSLLRWLQGATSLDDMVTKLQTKANSNPWVSQLITELSDKTGKYTDFQSQFYGVFSKAFQPYSIVRLDNGKYYSMMVNEHPTLTEAMNSITAQFQMQEHPLFGTNGKINTELLGKPRVFKGQGKDAKLVTEGTVADSYDFNLNQALYNMQQIVKRLDSGEQFDGEVTKEAAKWLTGVYRVLGYPVTNDMASEVINNDNIKNVTSDLGFIVKDLNQELDIQRQGNAQPYKPFTYGAQHNIGSPLRRILKPITDSLDDTAVSAFYESGNMYQSYVTPSFMTKLMNSFHLPEEKFREFIMNEYGNSEWFRKPMSRKDILHDGGYRLNMLEELAFSPEAREVFRHKVQLNFNKHNYMENMTPSEYTLSLFAEYFTDGWTRTSQGHYTSWFRMPIPSNKPSSEFFHFYSYRDKGYKTEITNQLYKIFLQEIDRIRTVKMRNLSKTDDAFIKNFDTNGRKFCFLDFLNSYIDNSNISKNSRNLLRNEDNTISNDNERLANLLQRKIEGLEDTKLNTSEETELSSLVERAINSYMENFAQRQLDEWDNEGIIEAARNIKNIVQDESFLRNDEKDPVKRNEYIREALENYIWNDYLASQNILEIVIGDTAFYKDAEDLQKRLSEYHAPGIRGNKYATDYEGHRVSDGTYRTVVLKDWDNFISTIIDNISEVFDRRIARAPESQKAQMQALKESLVGKDGAYRKINVADAEGYSSPSSYRKKAFMFGKWSHEAEDIYQNLLKGQYTFTDLQHAFQPLKPFVFTHLQKNLGVGNAPIHTMHVPFQAKNSEYLLIMADAMMKGEEAISGKLSKPNLLRAVYRVMEDSEKLNPTKGIDTVQFESAIKSGLQGAIDIHQFADMEGGEEAAYSLMMNSIYKQNEDGTRSNDYNTDVYIHEGSYDDYCIQQEIPEHFREHSQAHGSQIRMIIPSDLDSYKDPNGDHNNPDNINYYEWTEPDGTKKRLTASEFRKEYEDTIAENIDDSMTQLAQELHLNSTNKKERNIALSKILEREILSSPRYGIDLLQACSVDKNSPTGEFRIPKGDPIQAKRIEQLINSIIKNRINKQKIAGGPIVQVSNFGTSKQLHIRFHDKQGNILKTKEEFDNDAKLKEQYKTYKQYAKENQAGIAYFEVFAPIWSEDLVKYFGKEIINPDGTKQTVIDMEALENCDPELTRMVSYRIPTEDKYSIAPMKVVGFMPREAGDAIMLPYELTTIDDSDFDIDKRYVMRKDLPIVKKKRKEIFDAMKERVLNSYEASKGKPSFETKNKLIDQINMVIDNPDRMKDIDALTKYLYSIYQKVAYNTEKEMSGRRYRDNKIIDMSLAVLTNEMTADKILNPGGFEDVAKRGYMIAAYKAAASQGVSWSSLQSMSEDELKALSYKTKNLAEVGTQVQFYRQNSSTSSLIGIFAVNKVAHAVLEADNILINIPKVVGAPFTIAGYKFDSRMPIDTKYDSEGNLTGKTLGSMVSASADGVKKPVLNLMNVNTTTANVWNTMLRLGMPLSKVSLFMSQDVITRVIRDFNSKNLSNYVPLSTVISDQLKEFEKDNSISDNSNIKTEELTEEQLIEGLLPTEHKATDYKVLLAYQKLMQIAGALRNPTFSTRFNSISSAVGPLIVDNLILEHKMEAFGYGIQNKGTTFFYNKDGDIVDIDDIFENHPILKEFAKSVDIAKDMFSDMPASSQGFRSILKSLPDTMKERVFNDRKLLSDLSDFYQSYLLVQNGLIDAQDLKYYIAQFPKEFNEKNYKEKYKDNALIQAINLNASRSTNRPYLSVRITGMDQQQKDELSSAWIDLCKEDMKLATKLFNYCFFRAGIGFSPKTFMALVPTYLKENLSNTLKDGTKVSYIDTYRNFPEVDNSTVIDQFVRNNWDNNKLVPWKGGKNTKYSYDYYNGRVEVRNPDDIEDLKNVAYFKTKAKGTTYLWKARESNIGSKDLLIFDAIKPLGDNHEYLEMYPSNYTPTDTKEEHLINPITDTTKSKDNNDATIMEEQPITDAEEVGINTKENDNHQTYQMSELANLLQKQNPRLSGKIGLEKIEDIKKKLPQYKKFLVNVFKQKGLDLNEQQAMEEFKKYC